MEKIANVADNWLLHRKAYLIEFIGTDGITPDDVFTFSVPPESEELVYTQRKTETKTFGGLHVDEYGIDAVKIILSGSTVNQELKLVYGGGQTGSDKWLTGEDEIYYLRDLIKKHRSIDKLIEKKDSKRKIMIYDLSKAAYTKTGEQTRGNIKNYWQAFPGDFKIRRSSDKPFTYKYTFEFTGISLEGEKDFIFNDGPNGGPPEPELTSSKLNELTTTNNGGGDTDISTIDNNNDNNINTNAVTSGSYIGVYEALIKALDFIDEKNSWVNAVLDKVNQVSKLLKILGNVLSYATNTLSGIVDSAGNTVAGMIDGAARVVDGVNSVLSLPRTVQLKALNVGLELQNATNRLMQSNETLVKNCRDMFTGKYERIPQEVLDQYAMNNEEFKDSVNVLLDRAENITNELAAAAKSADIPDVTIGNPDPVTGTQRIVLSYGHTNITLKSTDTLESLAKQYLGDPDKAIDIAAYNGIASIDDLKPGDVIRLPIIARTQRMKNNRIFARREDRDNYGRDILLTDDGFIAASSSGDYALTSGVKNLSQAILLRLKESVARRIRLNAYGIRVNIGNPAAGIAYIVSSVELTVASDPRVSTVDNIRFSGMGDYLNINVDYSDINSAGGNVAGRV